MAILRFPEINWRRATAEVALIFVGISLALLFDNWNSDRHQRALERQLLVEVRDDLAETRDDLLNDIKNSELRLAAWRNLTAALLDEAPLGDAWATELRTTMGSSVLIAKTSAYRALTSQGLGILSDPAVRKAITDFYELRMARVSEFEGRLRDHYFGTFLPFTRQLTAPAPETIRRFVEISDHPAPPGQFLLANPDALKSSQQIASQFLDMAAFTRRTLNGYQEALPEIDAAIRLIDGQLSGNSSFSPSSAVSSGAVL